MKDTFIYGFLGLFKYKLIFRIKRKQRKSVSKIGRVPQNDNSGIQKTRRAEIRRKRNDDADSGGSKKIAISE